MKNKEFFIWNMECQSPSYSSQMTMKFAIPSIILFLAVLASSLASCGGISDPNQIVFPADSVSYAKDVDPLMRLSCEATGCHNAIDEAGQVDLSSWIQILNGQVPVVIPRDTTASLLFKVVYGEELHNAPINVNANQRKGLATWIMEGAPDN